jgi:hypothetical protein
MKARILALLALIAFPLAASAADPLDLYKQEVIAKAPKEHFLLTQKNYLEHLMLNTNPNGLRFPLERAPDFFLEAESRFPSLTRAQGPEALKAQSDEIAHYLANRPTEKALEAQVRSLLSNQRVVEALMTTHPEDAWRFKEFMPKTLIRRQQKSYYQALEQGLKDRVFSAADDAEKNRRLSQVLSRIADHDKTDELAKIFVRLQEANPKAEIIGHLNVRLAELDPEAAKRVTQFVERKPWFFKKNAPDYKAQAPARHAALPPVDRANVPPLPAAGPGPGGLKPPTRTAHSGNLAPTSFTFPDDRGLGQSRNCLMNAFRAFVR